MVMRRKLCVGLCLLLLLGIPFHPVYATGNDGAMGGLDGREGMTEERRQEDAAANKEDASGSDSAQETVSDQDAADGNVPGDAADKKGVPDSDVSANAATAGDVSGGDEKSEGQKTDRPKDVMAFRVPTTLDFVMDPMELSEKGQIYSEEYYFSNQGSQKIRIKLSGIRCMVAEDVRTVGDEAVTEDIVNSEEKSIRLQMLLETGEVITLREESTEYEFVLEAGQKFGLQMTGNMSRRPSPFWTAGDVRVAVVYEAVLIPDETDMP